MIDKLSDEALELLLLETAWEPERKRYSAAFHYRNAEDENAAVTTLRRVERRALELGLRPRWGRKVLEVLDARRAQVAQLLARLTPDGLDRACTPRGGQIHVVDALQVVLFETWAHHQYATRDLAILEQSTEL